MRGTRIILCAAAGLSLSVPAAKALAQGVLIPPTRQYQTPLYRPPSPSTLDKNYGLPNFGMPGSELPKQHTMAPGDQATNGLANRPGGARGPGDGAPTQAPDAFGLAPPTPDPALPDAPDSQTATTGSTGVPDFFSSPPDFVLPQPPVSPNATPSATPDTPMFSTAEGSRLNDTGTSIFSPTPASGAARSADGMDTPLFTTTDGDADPTGQTATPQ